MPPPTTYTHKQTPPTRPELTFIGLDTLCDARWASHVLGLMGRPQRPPSTSAVVSKIDRPMVRGRWDAAFLPFLRVGGRRQKGLE